MPRKLPRILIVDDDSVTCELLCEVFAREGFETAVRAVKEGAFDYLSKPFDIDELVATVRRALATEATTASALPAEEEERTSGIIGRTPGMLEVYKMIARVSDAPAAVLITGESG